VPRDDEIKCSFVSDRNANGLGPHEVTLGSFAFAIPLVPTRKCPDRVGGLFGPAVFLDQTTGRALTHTFIDRSSMLAAQAKSKEFGTQLWTRETARPIRSRLGDILETMREGDVLAIDASGVDVFDFSLAAELFGKALSRLGVDYPGRFVVAEGLTESARENLNQALEASNLIMIERHGNEHRLLGKVHQFDRDTFAGILEAGEAISAAALGKKLNASPTFRGEDGAFGRDPPPAAGRGRQAGSALAQALQPRHDSGRGLTRPVAARHLVPPVGNGPAR
jgi:hypothetical protein